MIDIDIYCPKTYYLAMFERNGTKGAEQMVEKVMVDFPAFITRDREARHLLVGDDSHVLLSNTIIAEMYRRLFSALGYEDTARIIYESAKGGTYQVQKNLLAAYRVTLKGEEDLINRIAKIPLYI